MNSYAVVFRAKDGEIEEILYTHTHSKPSKVAGGVNAASDFFFFFMFSENLFFCHFHNKLAIHVMGITHTYNRRTRVNSPATVKG